MLHCLRLEAPDKVFEPLRGRVRRCTKLTTLDSVRASLERTQMS